MTTCVFCGEPIGDDEPTAGRPPMAAHAACADAALADDAHWDRVAAATPEPDADAAGDAAPATNAGSGSRGGGCLTVVVGAILPVVPVLVALG